MVGRNERGEQGRVQATDRIVSVDQMRSKCLIDLVCRAAQDPKLVAIEGGGETGFGAPKDTSRGEKLERNPSFQQGRPCNIQRHRCSYLEFVLGKHQNSAT